MKVHRGISRIYQWFICYLFNMFYTSFGWYLCRIQYKKNIFFIKKYLIPLSYLCKLYHETDCHRFDEYKHKKPLWNHLETVTKLKVPRKTSLGRFSKNTLTHS